MDSETKDVAKRQPNQRSSLLARIKKHSAAISVVVSLVSVGLTQIEPLRLLFATPEYFFSTPKSMRIVSVFGVLHFVPIVSITNTGKKTAVIDRVDLYVEKRESAAASYRQVLRAEGHYFEPNTSNPNWIPTTYPLHFIRLTPEGWLSANFVYQDSTDRKWRSVSEFQSKAAGKVREARLAVGIAESKQGTAYDLGSTGTDDVRKLIETNLGGFAAGTYHLLFAFSEAGKESPSVTRAYSIEILPEYIKSIYDHKPVIANSGSDELTQRVEMRVRLTPITESVAVNRLVAAYQSAGPSP